MGPIYSYHEGLSKFGGDSGDYGDGEKDGWWQLTAAMAAATYTHFQLQHGAAFYDKVYKSANLFYCMMWYGIICKLLKALSFTDYKVG